MGKLRHSALVCLKLFMLLIALLFLSCKLPQVRAQEDKPPADDSGAFTSSAAQIVNGDFENGRDGSWAEFSTYGQNILINSGFPVAVTPHSGSWAARLGGNHSGTASISQTVTLPALSPVLSFWQWIVSEEGCGYYFDQETVLINGTALHTVDLCTETATTGWTRQAIDLNTYAGQTVSLEFRVETDFGLTSTLFLDDVSLGSFTNRIYVPLIAKNFVPGQIYYDDFSNSTSGWGYGETTDASYWYLAGEYQLMLKNAGKGFLLTPDLVLPENYIIHVDARQDSSIPGSYGISFSITPNGSSYDLYQFLVYPDSQEYYLEKSVNGTWTPLIDWTHSNDIHAGAATNHLTVERSGTTIQLYVNNQYLTTFTDTSITGAGKDAGIRAYSYDDAPVDMRFDNFRVIGLP